MTNYIIVGATYGDEGKGLVTNYIFDQLINTGATPFGVFQSGTFQRSHTSWQKRTRYIHRIVTAGYNHEVPTYYNDGLRGVFIEPRTFTAEYMKYKRAPEIYVGQLGQYGVITPADIYLSELQNSTHTSCGFGYWQAFKRSFVHKDHLLKVQGGGLTHKLDPDEYFEVCVAANKEYAENIEGYNGNHITFGDVREATEAFKFFAEHVHILEEDIVEKQQVIEDSQGLGLKFCSPMYSTTTSLGLSGARQMDLLESRHEPISVWYVMRTYETRHGAGPMSCELPATSSLVQHMQEDKTNVYNDYQGDFRIGLRQRADYDTIADNIKQDILTAGLLPSDIQLNLVLTHCNEYLPEDDPRKIMQELLPSATIWESWNEKEIERYWQ